MLLGRGSAEIPIRLWTYCSKIHAKDGNLSGYSNQEIEAIVEWLGEPGKMIEALEKIGFIDKTEDGWKVHNWEKHQKWFIFYHKRAKKAAKKRWEVIDGENATVGGQAMLEHASSNARACFKHVTNVTAKPSDILPPNKEYTIRHPLQSVVCKYKALKGIQKDDRSWDKVNWKRSVKSAKHILEVIGSWEGACDYMDIKSKEFEQKKLNWTIETLVRYVDEFKSTVLREQKT